MFSSWGFRFSAEYILCVVYTQERCTCIDFYNEPQIYYNQTGNAFTTYVIGVYKLHGYMYVYLSSVTGSSPPPITTHHICNVP